MDTSKLVTQWLIFITGLSGAAALVMPIFNFTIAVPASLCMSSAHYSLPAIRSMCVEHLRYIWSLLTCQQDHSLQGPLITPRNLFLLVNLIIFFLFASLHLQQHAAAGKMQKRRIQRTENSINNHQPVLQSLQPSSLIGLSLKREVAGRVGESFDEELASVSAVTGGRASMESLISEAAPTESTSNLPTSGSLLASWTVDRDGIDGSNVEKIVLEEDGRLRLIEGSPRSSKTCNLRTSANSDDREPTDGSDCGKIMLEEDGQLRLIEESPPSPKTCNLQTLHSDDCEATNGSDNGSIVLQKDGRLRLIDRPLPASPYKPVKSHSGDGRYNQKVNYIESEYNNNDISHNNHSLNNNYSNLRDNYDISDNISDSNKNDNTIISDFYNNNINLSDNYDSSDNSNAIISHNNHGCNNSYTNLSLANNGDNNIQSLSLKQNDLNSNFSQEAQYSKSSSVLANVSRSKVKKYESLDTMWTAINHSRDTITATNASSSSSSSSSSSRDHKRIISRHNSRHEFKPSRGGGSKVLRARPVRREPSLGQEELNSKVESFIARFNEQIRIQRQQSILSYMQMVDRGA